jgi:hypothetical protein
VLLVLRDVGQLCHERLLLLLPSNRRPQCLSELVRAHGGLGRLPLMFLWCDVNL